MGHVYTPVLRNAIKLLFYRYYVSQIVRTIAYKFLICDGNPCRCAANSCNPKPLGQQPRLDLNTYDLPVLVFRTHYPLSSPREMKFIRYAAPWEERRFSRLPKLQQVL